MKDTDFKIYSSISIGSSYCSLPFSTSNGSGIREVRLNVERRKVTEHTRCRNRWEMWALQS